MSLRFGRRTARQRDARAELKKEWVPYARISNHLKRAVIAAEDAKFSEHEGFDWEGIQKALEKNQKKGKIVAGGSTISQQLAKNLFLSASKTPWRKAQEAVITSAAGRRCRMLYPRFTSTRSNGHGVPRRREAAACRAIKVRRPAAEQAARLARTPAPSACPARPSSTLCSTRPPRSCGKPFFRALNAADILFLDRASRRLSPLYTRHPPRFYRRRRSFNRGAMSDIEDLRQSEDVQQDLREVQELLARHRVVEGLVHRQEMPRHEQVEEIVHKQHIAELRRKLDRLHPADIAYILEALPLDERLFVWDLVKADRDGEILLEVSDAVRETLIEAMDSHELVAATEQLDTGFIADLGADLLSEVMQDLPPRLSVEESGEQLRAAISSTTRIPVGAPMDFEA